MINRRSARALVTGAIAVVGLVVALPRMTGCLVKEYCFDNQDCPGNELCDPATGTCHLECVSDDECGGIGFTCEENVCEFTGGEGELTCPDGMVPILAVFCIDVWEASRPDATLDSAGTNGAWATSRRGVIPWYDRDPEVGMNQAIASAACEAANKRLCSAQEWRAVCRGSDDLDYCYGDDYDALACNGIDTYCTCDGEDPYPHCYLECGADFHVMPTGSFPRCTNGFGVWDINGNVWEIVAADDGFDHYRGGAYNCTDSEQLHHCDYDATWNPSAKGFRCCADGILTP
ncbi:MAG: SUMF1/EgtB/PvdO family nonheme iron enzyme [Deltaproteobacteria bacterium]|nr:SUMF1/EgtB/PvdO family nonheme iron enzyme [Deltaproteobacteria bacterium]